MTKDPQFLTVAEAAGLIAARKRSPIELTEAYLDRIEALDEQLVLPTSEPAGTLEPAPAASTFTKSSYTAAFSTGGNPALSVCCGFNGQELPFSLQIVGKLFDEAMVLRTGGAHERATPWRERRPALAARATA